MAYFNYLDWTVIDEKNYPTRPTKIAAKLKEGYDAGSKKFFKMMESGIVGLLPVHLNVNPLPNSGTEEFEVMVPVKITGVDLGNMMTGKSCTCAKFTIEYSGTLLSAIRVFNPATGDLMVSDALSISAEPGNIYDTEEEYRDCLKNRKLRELFENSGFNSALGPNLPKRMYKALLKRAVERFDTYTAANYGNNAPSALKRNLNQALEGYAIKQGFETYAEFFDDLGRVDSETTAVTVSILIDEILRLTYIPKSAFLSLTSTPACTGEEIEKYYDSGAWDN